jgi:hypothetical protein
MQESITYVHESDRRSPVLVRMLRHSDGGLSAHGKELKDFLSGITLVNGLSVNQRAVANGMDCLAAQIVAHFKGVTNNAGGIYLTLPTMSAEGADFSYRVFEQNKVIYLEVEGREVVGDGRPHLVNLLPDSFHFFKKEPRIVSFLYTKKDGVTHRRLIRVTDDSDAYLEGFDLDDADSFKRFSKSKTSQLRTIVLEDEDNAAYDALNRDL